MRKRRNRERGSLLIEFTLCAIPLMFLLVALIQMSMTMWHYHTLAEAVSYATRTASGRGTGCIGKTCATTIGDMSTDRHARDRDSFEQHQRDLQLERRWNRTGNLQPAEILHVELDRLADGGRQCRRDRPHNQGHLRHDASYDDVHA